jgi:hypothetical protein
MRVKLCARCPYSPRDLADHYDPEAVAHVCARCDGEQDKLKLSYPREAYRRRKCSIVPIIFNTPQPSAAPCVADSSASSGIIPAELRSVRKNAVVASSFVGRATANGCASFEPPENRSVENRAAIFPGSEPRDKESAH